MFSGRSLAPIVCLAIATASIPALARRPGADGNKAPPHGSAAGSSSGPLTDDQLQAQQHFQRAKDLYQAGNYREAIAELEVAHSLDPKAKDLVMNLGILHEKLGKYDQALGYFKTYLEMDVTPPERQKAEGIIKRIEGAKKDQPAPPSASASAAPVPPSASTAPPPPPGPPPPHGRVDGATIAVGAVAGFFLVAGLGTGIFAYVQKPSDFVTGQDGSFADLQKRTQDAHVAAIIADASMGLGVVLAGVTALLYFGRTKEPKQSAFVTPLGVTGSF